MTSELAKSNLKAACNATERHLAIEYAIKNGMAFQEIEQILDWVDAQSDTPMRRPNTPKTNH